MDTLVERVEKLEEALYACGVCRVSNTKDDPLVASCLYPDKMICNKCVDDIREGVLRSPSTDIENNVKECSFCGLDENTDVLWAGYLTICAQCVEQCVHLIENHDRELHAEANLSLEERVLRLEMSFSSRMSKPVQGFLFERIHKQSHWWLKWTDRSKSGASSTHVLTKEELTDCVDRLEQIENS